jgi:hypothetical protein
VRRAARPRAGGRGGLRPSPLAAAGLAVLLALACGRGCEPADEQAPARAVAPADAGTPARRASDPGAAPAALPLVGPGGVAVRYAGGRVSLVSRGAPLAHVLAELGRAARFAVENVGPEADRPVQARIEDAPLAEALSRVLRGSDWSAGYVSDRKGAHRLARLWLGPAPRASAEAGRAAEPDPVPEEEIFDQSEEPGADAPRWTPDDQLRYEAEREADLDSRDPQRRAEAVEELDYSSLSDFEYLVRFAREDPEPSVRVSAIEALEGDTSFGALRALADALGDADPEVVIAAVEALAALDDETVVPELEALREHRDAGVRAAAEEAIESLEE